MNKAKEELNMTKHRVRVPQVADISAAIRLYYEHTEIGNKDIRAIFGDMGNGRDRQA